MADEWCPMPLALSSEQSHCPHETVGTSIDGLWNKFLSSPLLAEKVRCNCEVTADYSNQNLQGKSNVVVFKKLE